MSVAGVAHLVERHLAKVEVASSSLVARSKEQIRKYLLFFARFPRLEGWNLTVQWTVNLRLFRREFKRRTRGGTAFYGRNAPGTVSFEHPNS